MYSETVKSFPVAIFVCGAALLFVSCGALLLVRPALKEKPKKKTVRRGRSTRKKALSSSLERGPAGRLSGNVTEEEV